MSLPLAKPGAPRSLSLFALGAGLGLAIAAYGLFTAKGARVREPPPEATALVNGRPILTSDFMAQNESEFGVGFAQTTAGQRQKVLEDMIAEELFVQRGLELELAASDPDVRAALSTGVQRQIWAGATADMPNDETLRKFYDSNRDKYSSEGTMRLRDFVVPPPAAAGAGEIADTLRRGDDVGAAIAQHGLREAAASSARMFDFAARARMGDALFDAADKLANGGVSDPIDASDGVHIILMIERRPPTPLPFEKAREQTAADYIAAEKDHLLKAELRFLRDKADVLIAGAPR